MRVPDGDRGGRPPRIYNNVLIGIFLRENGITPRGNLNALTGLKVKREMLPAVKDLLNGAKAVFISHTLTFHQLTELFNQPDQLTRHLVRENGTSKVLSAKEIRGPIETKLAADLPAGLVALAQKAGLFAPEEIAALLRDRLGPISALFGEERAKSKEFDALLALLATAGSQELCRTFISELLDTEKHDQAWVAAALQFFRDKYPGETYYHATDGEQALKYRIGDIAANAFRQALAIEPRNKALRSGLKQAEQLQKDQRIAAKQAFRGRVDELWRRLGEDGEAAVQLIRLIDPNKQEFENYLTEKNGLPGDRAQALARFELLAAAAEDAGLFFLTGYFGRCQDRLVAELLDSLVIEHRLGPSELALIVRMIKDEEIISLPPELIGKFAAAAGAKRHAYRPLCEKLYAQVYGGRLEAAQELFKRGLAEQALPGLEECLKAYPGDKAAARSLARIYTERAKRSFAGGDRAETERILRRAIDLCPTHAPALEILAIVAGANGRQAEAIEHYKKALSGIASGSLNDNPGYEQQALKRIPGKLGALYYELYATSKERKHLEQAAKLLPEGLKNYPDEARYWICYFNTCRLLGREKEFDRWLGKYLKGESPDLKGVLDSLWAAEDREVSGYIARYATGRAPAGSEHYYLGLFHLARLMETDKQLDRAAAALEEVIGSGTTAKIYRSELERTVPVQVHAAEFYAYVIHQQAKAAGDEEKGKAVYAAAIEIVGRVNEKFPGNPAALNCLGALREERGDWAEAGQHYLAAIALDDGYLVPQINLVKALFKAGDRKGALERLKMFDRAIGRMFRENKLERFKVIMFIELLAEFYVLSRSPEALGLLRRLLDNPFQLDYLPGLKQVVAEMEEKGRRVPEELLRLIPAHK